MTAIETYPGQAVPYCNAGAVAIEKGNTKHAKQLLRQAIEIDDLLAEAYNNLGVIAIFENNYDAASELFKHAKKLGLNTNYNEGVVHINKGNYDKAVKLMTKNVKCLEENGKTLYLQAIIASRTKDVEKSLNHLAKAINKDSKLKKTAKQDMEFAYMYDNPDFIALTE